MCAREGEKGRERKRQIEREIERGRESECVRYVFVWLMRNIHMNKVVFGKATKRNSENSSDTRF